jgi:hypothetical protein
MAGSGMMDVLLQQYKRRDHSRIHKRAFLGDQVNGKLSPSVGLWTTQELSHETHLYLAPLFIQKR